MNKPSEEIVMQSSKISESSSEDEIPDTPRERSVYKSVKAWTRLKSCENSIDKSTGTCRPPTPVPISDQSSDEFDLQRCARRQSSCPNRTAGNYELQSGTPRHIFRKNPFAGLRVSSVKDPSSVNTVAMAAGGSLDCNSKSKLTTKWGFNKESKSSRGQKLAVSSSDSDGECLTRRLQAKKCTKVAKKGRRNIRCRSLSFSDKEEEDTDGLQTRKRKIHCPLSENTPDSFINEIFNSLDNKGHVPLARKHTDFSEIDEISACKSIVPASQNNHETMSMLQAQVPEDSLTSDTFCRDAGAYFTDENSKHKPGNGKVDRGCENNAQSFKQLDKRKHNNTVVNKKTTDSASMKFAFPARMEVDAGPSTSCNRGLNNSSDKLCASGPSKSEMSSVINDMFNIGDEGESTECANVTALKKYRFKRMSSVDKKAQNGDDQTINIVNAGFISCSSAAGSASTSTKDIQSELSAAVCQDETYRNIELLSKDVKPPKASSKKKGKTSTKDNPRQFDLMDTDAVPHSKKVSADNRRVTAAVRRRNPILSDDETLDCLPHENNLPETRKNRVSYIQIDSDESSDDSGCWNGIDAKPPTDKHCSAAANARQCQLGTKAVRVPGDSSGALSRKQRAQLMKAGSRRVPSLSTSSKHSVENLTDDLVLITEVTGIRDRSVIETAVSRVCDYHGSYYVSDVINHLLSDECEQGNWCNDSLDRVLGDSSRTNAQLMDGDQPRVDTVEHNDLLSTGRIDPLYTSMMCSRINRFTDYQWQVHMAIHDGTDVPPSPEDYNGPSPDSLVDSEVLQYMVHCRESGLPLPHRGTSIERPANRRNSRIPSWRTRHPAVNGGVETGRGGSSESNPTMAQSSRSSHVLRANRRQRQDRSNVDADELPGRLRARTLTRANTTNESTGSSTSRPERPVVGRAQRQTDTQWDSLFQHIYNGFMGGSRQANREMDRRASSFRRPRRRPRVRSPTSWDLDDYDGMFNRNATRQPDTWSRNVDRQVSLLSRTHLLDMAESNEIMDDELDELDGRFDRSGSWIRGLHGHLSLLSRTHLLDMDESDDVSDEYEHLLSIIERVGDAVPRGLESRVIRQLPTKSFSMSEVKEGESSPECNICICEYVEGDRLRILQCLHRFHAKCIDKWLSENRTCPICRVEVHV